MGSINESIQIASRNGKVLSEAAIKQLKSTVKGEIVFKGGAPEDIYRNAIDRFNKAGITEASIIVFVESEEDVSASLQFVQQWDLDLAIACGRHSYYGASSTTGLVIDLQKMRKVSVDVANRSVTAQGGCKAVHVEKPVAAEGYSIVFGVANDTGIGGITLGGGSGPLTGQYGLTCDNLIAARVVLADGRVVEASEGINADLFWGLRGGGSNFGVVTEFTFRIHKQQGLVFQGPLIYRPGQIKDILNLVGPMKRVVDDPAVGGKLVVMFAFLKPPGAPKVLPAAIMFYDGPEDEARKLLAPLYDLGPSMDMATMKEYHTTTDPNPLIDGPPSHQNYSASNCPLWSADDVDILEDLVKDFEVFMDKYSESAAVSKIAIEIRSYAKSASVPVPATAFAARREALMSIVEAQYDSSVSHELMREEVKKMSDKVKNAVKAKHPDTSVVHNANLATGREKTVEIFGENLPKLRELKRKYDPNFVFNKWYPITPTEA